MTLYFQINALTNLKFCFIRLTQLLLTQKSQAQKKLVVLLPTHGVAGKIEIL